jgi:membrane protein DedA with SNARE-associated domain
VNTGHLLTSFGYWAVFIVIGLESLGVPLPGETILISAGILAGHNHKLNPWLIWLVAAAGAIIGDNIGFWVGDKGGYALLKKYGRYIRVREPEIKLGRYIFDRQGGKVVFFGRFVSVLRTYAAFLAGTTRMEWRKFLLFNAAGGIVWAGIYTFVSYYAGNRLRRSSGKIDLTIGAVAVVAIIAGIVLLRRKSKQLVEVAEQAYPGPLPD